MAKVQGGEVKTVNAYGAERVPASFELVVNGSNGRGVQVKFNIRNLNGQNLYVSDPVNCPDDSFVAGALNEANLNHQQSTRKTFGPNGAPGCTIFQLSEVPIGRGNDPLPPQSKKYCEEVVAFVRGQQRVA
jgi:hypothetical protein